MTRASCKGLAGLAALLVLAGCVTTTVEEAPSAKTPGRTSTSAPVSPDATDDFVLSALPTQTLNVGECGLFLFTEKPSPRFVYFGRSAQRQGLIRHYGKDVTLELVEGGGEIVDQTYSKQTLVTRSGDLKVDISINAFEPGQEGSRVTSGSLRLTDPEGWVTVTPVAGATACRTS